MKTRMLLICLALLTVAGCKKEIKLEVKTIHESDRTSQWEIRIDRPVFSSTEKEVERSCVKFNDEVTRQTGEIRNNFIRQTQEAIAALDSMGEKLIAPYELIIEDSVFLADNNYISVRFLIYEFTGGAHGMTSFRALNYDVKKQHFLQPEELLQGYDLREVDDQLKANLRNPENCFDQTPTTRNATAVNLTLHQLEFTYAPYVLGPYSCGYTTISVPRKKQ